MDRVASDADLILHRVTRDKLLVFTFRAVRRMIGGVRFVVMMRVREEHPDRFQIDMPSRRAPSDGKQDGEKGAGTRHVRRTSTDLSACRKTGVSVAFRMSVRGLG